VECGIVAFVYVIAITTFSYFVDSITLTVASHAVIIFPAYFLRFSEDGLSSLKKDGCRLGPNLLILHGKLQDKRLYHTEHERLNDQQRCGGPTTSPCFL
jgi:hypothetical protein